MTAKLAHHNIISERALQGIAEGYLQKQAAADDFSLYLHMPTMTDPSMAPEGHEAFYVLSPVPHLANIDWDETAKPYRDAIMQFLEDNYLPDLQANIVTEHHIDPRTLRIR
jgi:phytoene desaturase